MAEARLFQALSDPTRLKIVGILAEGPLNVTGIVNIVKAAQPAVSRHLRILREVGLIHDRRLGKEVEYSLDTGRMEEASGWLGDLAGGGAALGPSRLATDVAGPPESGRSRGAGQPDRERPPRPGEEAGVRVSGPAAGGKARPSLRRVSPLAARRGVAGVSGGTAGAQGEEPPGDAPVKRESLPLGEARVGGPAPGQAVSRPKPKPRKVGKAKGVRASAGKRPKAQPKSRPRPKGARKKSVKRGPDTRPAYVVEREEDSIDDFLL